MHTFVRASRKGFTLIELIMSMFIFLVIMASLTQTFAGFFTTYRNAKAVQRNLESAQFAMNRLAKELRTSTIVIPTSTSTVSTIRFYDYSQKKCFQYVIGGTGLTVAEKGPSIPSPSFNPTDYCASGFGGASPIVAGASGSFSVTPSSETTHSVGKVVIELTISGGSCGGACQSVNIRTTVSLRDYGYNKMISGTGS